MYSAFITQHLLKFKTPAKTSRNTLEDKIVWLLHLSHLGKAVTGIGECSPLKGLSVDDVPGFEAQLNHVVDLLNNSAHPQELGLDNWPSITFGLETALLDLQYGGIRQITEAPFFSGKEIIPINGLVWMGNREEMIAQAEEKIKAGFTCIKFKIGAMDFDEECRMLEELRKKYTAFAIEIRLDANGAFAADTAVEQLNELAKFGIHSVEQPIKQGQWDAMQEVCAKSKIPIALDEELIGHKAASSAQKMLKTIQPAYIIIKPGLLGGFDNSKQWIQAAQNAGMGWWATSALESNIGLNAIAQFAATYAPTMPQGLGTGQLYQNNFESPLIVKSGFIYYDTAKNWQTF